jgi:DNA-directed RNA polymerase specialized sigma24 family protein
MIEPAYKNDLAALTCAQLAERCRVEQNRFRHWLPPDESFGLELFRRAICQRDEAAWGWVHQHFASTMSTWLLGHPCAWRVLRRGSIEDYVTEAWSRFWVATLPADPGAPLGFGSLRQVLAYLRLCLNSVVLDALRQPESEQASDHPAPADDFLSRLAVEELWQIIERALPRPRDQHLARLVLVEGYKPREIVALAPRDFSTVQEVYRLWRTILERLRRDPRLRRWFEQGTL